MSRQKKQKNKIITTLEKLGLTENEAILYEIMLSGKHFTIRELTLRSPFNRTMLYHVINKLLAKDLIATINLSGKRAYIATDPNQLYYVLTQQEKEFRANNLEIRNLIPKLRHRYHLLGARTHIRTFDGIHEYKKALEDIIISKPDKILSYRTMGVKKVGVQIWQDFDKHRITKKIDEEVLFPESKRSLQELLKYKYNDYTHFRSVTEKQFPEFEADISIYNDKVLYTNFNDTYEPTAILIEDKKMAEMQRNLFAIVWNNATERTLYFAEKNMERIKDNF